jgi:uncharacterized hydantoinase/oxoprolinase family protein
VLALGVDVGNAKIKLCLAREGARARWTSATLPYDARRPYARQQDFARGIPAALEAFLGPQREDVRAVVAVTSAGYAYPTFRESVVHLAAILDGVFPDVDCALLSGDGRAVTTERVLAGDDALLGPIAFTNPMGAAHLARRMGFHGLCLDTGGSTTGIVVLGANAIDPAALADPARHVAHRLRHGKLTWIGVQTTPLEALADEILDHPIIPRGVPFENVAVLLELLPARASKLAFFGLLPSRDDALRAIADAIGLDRTLVDDATLLAIARALHQRAVARLAEGIRRARATAPEEARARAICFGLGARGLARPSLLSAGYREGDILLADDRIAADLAEAASCVGAAHLALERAVGRELSVEAA